VVTGVVTSIVVHVSAVTALLFSGTAKPPRTPDMYAVELVAAPLPTGGKPAAREVPVAPPPAPAPAQLKPKAKTPPKPATKTPDRTAPVRSSTSPVTPLPGATPGTGSDIDNVKLQGKEFPYPEYLRNLVTQIYRRWSRPTGNASLQVEVAFVILRDGSIKDIRVMSTSRSYSFDEEAQGAIEAAGRARAFGPLPTGYQSDILPISFLFTPRQAP
jgi:outer membrane biosynthesis protein TonB